ncbi:MAG TPA: DUF1501 domain-containing protein [Planctomycetaceae bacterium]|nr:DUF1501 domain-containing protein [Planctomycetaceae bacterium]
MTISRRRFLAGTSSIALGLGLPGVFRRMALAAPNADQPGGGQSVLVVIELTGGNDGLNTVIPFKDPAYQAARPKLAQPRDQVKTINEDLAFHPAMDGFAELLEGGHLGFMQGVGYPEPNRSHFESMDIWHKATPAKEQLYGWLGRTAPELGLGGPMHVGGGEPPLALFGATGHAPSLRSLDEYQLKVGPDPRKRELIENFATGPKSDDELLGFVRQSARTTYDSSARLQQVAEGAATPVLYPDTGLANRLKLVARLIDAGVSERVYYTSIDGFDTHAAQAEQHARLLGELSGAVAAFWKDVAHHGHQDRVLVMTFSEFGRTVRENGSDGTDHGVASQMFLVGERVLPGPIGEHPSLTDLDSGDLKFHTDFRSVYATVLRQWLGVDPGKVLDRPYPELALFAGGEQNAG